MARLHSYLVTCLPFRMKLFCQSQRMSESDIRGLLKEGGNKRVRERGWGRDTGSHTGSLNRKRNRDRQRQTRRHTKWRQRDRETEMGEGKGARVLNMNSME